MSQALEPLYSDINAFLRGSGCPPPRECAPENEGLAFWRDHPSITTLELTMLAALAKGPARVADAARLLGRDCAATQEFLEALVGVGLLDQWGDRYYATAAAERYLEVYLDRPAG